MNDEPAYIAISEVMSSDARRTRVARLARLARIKRLNDTEAVVERKARPRRRHSLPADLIAAIHGQREAYLEDVDNSPTSLEVDLMEDKRAARLMISISGGSVL